MLFNSFEFIAIFLPAVLIGVHAGRRLHRLVPFATLVVASLAFYAYWSPWYLGLLLASTAANYAIGRKIVLGKRRGWLVLGVVGNLALLGYYKYANFFLANYHRMEGGEATVLNIVLPLGISFYTFQQVAFLVDRWRGKAEGVNMWDYAGFVLFFPQLPSGPIVRYAGMAPQWQKMRQGETAPVVDALLCGGGLFAFGLFKKTVIADSLTGYATTVFLHPEQATILTAWQGALSYTLQLYFDFSGYADMAIGAAAMCGLILPQNFDSPYRAASIIDFWRRWHITLSTFLRDYLYIQLGGNRDGFGLQLLYLMVTMILGGLWHGASWNFVIWGALHGVFLAGNHCWRRWLPWAAVPKLCGVLLTFLCVMIAWVPFRAATLEQAWQIWRAMANVRELPQLVAAAWRTLAAADLRNPVA
jgi:D-alanyl-lipoteichoic acid acyltransferase DltB (MBOAT superfamily)